MHKCRLSRSLLTFIFICASMYWITGSAFSQAADDPKQVLSSYMSSIREKKSTTESDVHLAQTYGGELIPDLEKYAKDPNFDVAHCAFRYLAVISQRSDSVSDRQRAVEVLLPLLDDQRLVRSVSKQLRDLRAGDFSEHSKQILSEIMQAFEKDVRKQHIQIAAFGATILASGIADAKSELPRLAPITLTTPQPGGEPNYWQSGPAWAALRARARMGVEEDVKKCIDTVESSSDKETRANKLFLSLAYVRQPEVAKYLVGYLNDDAVVTHSGSPGGGDPGQKTQVAGRAAEALATMLEGFPIRVSGPWISEKDLKTCREWVAAQKELKLIR